VPGDDAANDADRLAPAVAQHLLAEWYDGALDLAGSASEIAEDLGRALDLRPRLRPDRVPRLRGKQRRHLLGAPVDVVGDRPHELAPLAGGDQLPEFKGSGGRADGDLDVGGVRPRYLRDDAAPVSRVLHDQEAAAGALAPFAVDEHQPARDVLRSVGGSRL